MTGRIWLGIFTGCVAFLTSASAQLGGGAAPGSNPSLLKLFGKHQAFTARADAKIEQGGGSAMTMPMNMALSDKKLRAEIDMSEVKGSQFPAEAIVQLKKLNLDKPVSVLRPDKKVLYIIYPALKSYVEMPMPKEEAAVLDKDVKMKKTELGKETIDGHPCVKSKVVMTDDQGKAQEATIWEASDMKDFPVQVQMADEGANVVIRYSNVQLAVPPASLFEPPAGYAKYASMQELALKGMKQMSPPPGGQ
jgi:hypothetical protein